MLAGTVMRSFAAGLLLALLFVHQAQAVSLTLGCSGVYTATEVPKAGVAGDPEKDDVVDMSVVVDFDQRAVSGFWAEMNGVHNLIPITAVDANSVTFKGTKKFVGSDASIDGTVDRITGKVDANETWLWSNGGMRLAVWDLRCRPTKPLF